MPPRYPVIFKYSHYNRLNLNTDLIWHSATTGSWSCLEPFYTKRGNMKQLHPLGPLNPALTTFWAEMSKK